MSALPTCCPSPSLPCALQAAAPGVHTPLTFHRTSVSTKVLHTHQHPNLPTALTHGCRCPHCCHFASQMDVAAHAFIGHHVHRFSLSPSAAPHPSIPRTHAQTPPASLTHAHCRCPHCRHFAPQMDVAAHAFSGQHLKRIAPGNVTFYSNATNTRDTTDVVLARIDCAKKVRGRVPGPPPPTA